MHEKQLLGKLMFLYVIDLRGHDLYNGGKSESIEEVYKNE